MKHTLFVIILYTLAVFLPVPVQADWERSVTNYTRQTYRAASQNWDIMQQRNGWMYFANNKGLLEFDGSHWSVYSMNGVKPKAIAAGEDGRIYAGGLKEFGYFEPDEWGRLQYTSLSDSLNKVKNVWGVHVCDGKVFFREDNAVYCYEDGATRVFDNKGLVYSTLIDGRLYGASAGLYRQEGDTLALLPNTSGFVGGTLERRVVGMFPYGEKALLVVTAQNGLFLYEDGEWTPLPIPDSRLLRHVQLSCSAKAGNLLALGSVQDGVFLLDLAQGTVEHVSTHNGLQNKGVLALRFDRDGNLWAGLNSGIDCVLFHSSMPFRCTAIGSGYASCFYQGRLYLGTNQGLFVSDWPLPSGGTPLVGQTPWTAGQVYSLSVHRGDLFCAGSRALGVIGPDGRMQVIQGLPGIWHVAEIKGCDRLIAATYVGFYLLEKTAGRWRVAGKVKGTSYSAKSCCVEPGTGALWVANKEDGIHRLRLSARGDSIVHEKCHNSSAFPKGNNVCITVVDGRIVVASHQGLFRYDADNDTLARDTLLEKATDGATVYTYLRQDALRNIWYVTNGILKVLYYNALQDEYLLREGETYLADVFVEDFEHIDVYEPDEGKALVGLEDGFALLHVNHHAGGDTPPLTVQVRSVHASGAGDSLMYGSSYLPVPERRLRIPYAYNSLSIRYGAPNYDCQQLYATCLTGAASQEEWTEPENVTRKQYVSLPEGHYTFCVRAFTGNGKFVETALPFEILPPWYRSWWFRLGYALAACGALAFIVYRSWLWRKRLLLSKEQELYSQQQLFQEKSEKMDREIDLLREENLRTELNHRNEELAQTTLNIVRKNEMLISIRKEVEGISHSIKDEKMDIVSLRRKVFRLLGQIDTNLEHDDDLKAFQNSFDSVHHNFFRQLETAYPGLTSKEKQLCAYIKMNLLSKEIAPLLNISLRGVEISRYRLRKKLNLKEGENLTEFLQNFSRD